MAIRYIIVTTDKMLPVLNKFVETKQAKGYRVDIQTCERLESMYPHDVRHEAIKRYVRTGTGPIGESGFLLLVGDHETVPGYPLYWGGANLNFFSDSYYGLRDDNDVIPRLLTGRLSSNDPTIISSICDLLIEYPRNKEQEWLKRIILTGWVPRSPDATCEGYPDAGTLCVKEIGASHEIVMRFENDLSMKDGPLGKAETRKRMWRIEGTCKQDLINSIEKGAKIVRYLGHGNTTNWNNVGRCERNAQGEIIEDEILTRYDVYSLNVNWKTPLVISAACETGDLVMPMSFAETWQIKLKAIGVFASDDSGPNGYWNDRITERIFHQMIERGECCVGKMLAGAMQQLYNDYKDKNLQPVIKESFVIIPRMYRYYGDPDTNLPRCNSVPSECDEIRKEIAFKKNEVEILQSELHDGASPPQKYFFVSEIKRLKREIEKLEKKLKDCLRKHRC
jgi:hypothetical protein